MVMMLEALAARLPRSRVRTPLEGVTRSVSDTKVTLAGRVSFTIASGSVDGPLLVAVMVYVR